MFPSEKPEDDPEVMAHIAEAARMFRERVDVSEPLILISLGLPVFVWGDILGAEKRSINAQATTVLFLRIVIGWCLATAVAMTLGGDPLYRSALFALLGLVIFTYHIHFLHDLDSRRRRLAFILDALKPPEAEGEPK